MKIIIIALILVGIVLITVGNILLISFNPKLDITGYQLVDNLKVDIYSKKNISDFILSINGKLITNKSINTETLGTQKVNFIYENEKGKRRTSILNVEIVDEEEPLIWLSERYDIKVGSTINLEEEILCADNYDNNPKCRIEGTYDLNTPGAYNLTYIATDSSNNEERVNFSLSVYELKLLVENEIQKEKPIGTIFDEVIKNHKTENTEIGIDVSKWQGDIDFKKVKEAGATFVMIRVGSQQGVGGKYILDPYFRKNIEEATKNDLKVGGYFYSYASSNKEAIKQANWVLEQIQEYKLSLPIAFDWECYNSFNQMELSLFGLNQVAESFLEKIEEAGYDAMLYGSKNYLNSVWKYHNYDVWLAHYTNKTDYESQYVMWQLCQDGKIDGINTAVDINVLYKGK